MRIGANIAAIEIDGDTLRLAMVSTGGAMPKVAACRQTEVQYDSPDDRHDALAEGVRKLCAGLKPQPAGYVLCASSLYAITRNLTLPFKGRNKIAGAVKFELEPFLAVPIDDLVVDFSITREIEGSTEILVFGLRKEMLAADLAVLEEGGVIADGVTLDLAGLTSLYAGARKKMNGLQPVLHIRPDRCILTVMFNKKLAYVRQILRAQADIFQDPGAVGREVRNGLRAFMAGWKSDDSFHEISVTGMELDGPARAAFEEASGLVPVFTCLSEACKGKVPKHHAQQAPPPSIIDHPAPGSAALAGDDMSAQEPAAPGMTAAFPAGAEWENLIGAAHASAGTDYAYEFRKEEIANTHFLQGIARHLVFSGVLAAIVLIGYAGFTVVHYFQMRARLDAIGNEIWRLYTDAAPNSELAQAGRPSDDVGGARTFQVINEDLLGEGAIGVSFPTNYFEYPTLLDYLLTIGAYMPDERVKITDLRATALSAAQDNRVPRITIQGEVKPGGAFDEAFARLREEAQAFTIEDEPARVLREGKTVLTIAATR